MSFSFPFSMVEMIEKHLNLKGLLCKDEKNHIFLKMGFLLM